MKQWLPKTSTVDVRQVTLLLPRDALCPPVVSLNTIITLADSFIIVRLQIFHCVTLSSA